MPDQNPPDDAYGTPRTDPAWQGSADVWRTPSTEVLPSGPAEPSDPAGRPGRRRMVVAGVAVAAGVAAVAGGAYAYSVIGSGAGGQPEEHLPANAVFFLKLDLDPSVSQKVDAIRFASKFPQSRGLNWGSTDGDPRKWLYEQITKGSKGAPPWSEISGWLGKRAGVALIPSSGATPEAVPVLALQVSDSAKAAASIKSASSGTSNPLYAGIATDEGWAVVADTQAHADAALAAAAKAPLSKAPTFSADVADLGDQGIAALWVDYPALAKLHVSPSTRIGAALTSSGTLARAKGVSGHGALALRFSGADLEVAGTLREPSGLLMAGRGGTISSVDLPADSIAAVSVVGLGDKIAGAWPQLLSQLAKSTKEPAAQITQFEEHTGLRFPADLSALLGQQFSVAVSAAEGDRPQYGVLVKSSAANLDTVVGKVDDLARQGGLALSRASTPGGYVLASTEAEAAALAKGGTLGASSRFQNAVPNAKGASLVIYVDIAKAVTAFGSNLSRQDRATFSTLDAIGLSIARTGDRSAAFTLRLTTR